jgi:hypothetical protein
VRALPLRLSISIVAFVEKVTKEGLPDFVPPGERMFLVTLDVERVGLAFLKGEDSPTY